MIKSRLTIALLSFFLSVAAFAANKDLDKDITMVSYEQKWSDSNGTLALRNNSSEEVKNVVFLITYLDMSGNELDYEEFSKKVIIAPGKTKKLDIPAYESSRNYHYYKTKGHFGDHPTFKIKFQLKDYNVIGTVEESSGDIWSRNSDSERLNSNPGLSMIVMAVVFLLFIGVVLGLYVLVAVMAQKRNRSVVVWVLLSFFASPLLAIIILLAIGKNERYFENRYDRE